MKILYLIPARGGSKGLPGKNIKELNGKPLIVYSIEVVKGIKQESDELCVSTDSLEIKKVVEEAGVKVPFLRPAEISTDVAGTYEVILHALKYYELQGMCFDAVMLLQPTSPFRKSFHLSDVVHLYNNNPGVEMVVSVKESKENPYFNLFEESDSGYLRKSKEGDYVRRQDCPPVYAYNGSIYLINKSALMEKPLYVFDKVIKYVMEEQYSIDIDTARDFEIAEIMSKTLK